MAGDSVFTDGRHRDARLLERGVKAFDVVNHEIERSNGTGLGFAFRAKKQQVRSPTQLKDGQLFSFQDRAKSKPAVIVERGTHVGHGKSHMSNGHRGTRLWFRHLATLPSMNPAEDFSSSDSTPVLVSSGARRSR